jgi:hypothetical protein
MSEPNSPRRYLIEIWDVESGAPVIHADVGWTDDQVRLALAVIHRLGIANPAWIDEAGKGDIKGRHH